jgi:hypothetical protein
VCVGTGSGDVSAVRLSPLTLSCKLCREKALQCYVDGDTAAVTAFDRAGAGVSFDRCRVPNFKQCPGGVPSVSATVVAAEPVPRVETRAAVKAVPDGAAVVYRCSLQCTALMFDTADAAAFSAQPGDVVVSTQAGGVADVLHSVQQWGGGIADAVARAARTEELFSYVDVNATARLLHAEDRSVVERVPRDAQAVSASLAILRTHGHVAAMVNSGRSSVVELDADYVKCAANHWRVPSPDGGATDDVVAAVTLVMRRGDVERLTVAAGTFIATSSAALGYLEVVQAVHTNAQRGVVVKTALARCGDPATYPAMTPVRTASPFATVAGTEVDVCVGGNGSLANHVLRPAAGATVSFLSSHAAVIDGTVMVGRRSSGGVMGVVAAVTHTGGAALSWTFVDVVVYADFATPLVLDSVPSSSRRRALRAVPDVHLHDGRHLVGTVTEAASAAGSVGRTKLSSVFGAAVPLWPVDATAPRGVLSLRAQHDVTATLRFRMQSERPFVNLVALSLSTASVTTARASYTATAAQGRVVALPLQLLAAVAEPVKAIIMVGPVPVPVTLSLLPHAELSLAFAGDTLTYSRTVSVVRGGDDVLAWSGVGDATPSRSRYSDSVTTSASGQVSAASAAGVNTSMLVRTVTSIDAPLLFVRGRAVQDVSASDTWQTCSDACDLDYARRVAVVAAPTPTSYLHATLPFPYGASVSAAAVPPRAPLVFSDCAPMSYACSVSALSPARLLLSTAALASQRRRAAALPASRQPVLASDNGVPRSGVVTDVFSQASAYKARLLHAIATCDLDDVNRNDAACAAVQELNRVAALDDVITRDNATTRLSTVVTLIDGVVAVGVRAEVVADNWRMAQDVAFVPVTAGTCASCWVHRGAHRGVESLLAGVLDGLGAMGCPPGGPVLLAGRSFAGALAQLLAYRLRVLGYVPAVYTVDAPHLGNAPFIARMATVVPVSFNTVQGPDVVANVLGFVFGFDGIAAREYAATSSPSPTSPPCLCRYGDNRMCSGGALAEAIQRRDGGVQAAVARYTASCALQPPAVCAFDPPAAADNCSSPVRSPPFAAFCGDVRAVRSSTEVTVADWPGLVDVTWEAVLGNGECHPWWTGVACRVPRCRPAPVFGRCFAGGTPDTPPFVICDAGWSGPACNIRNPVRARGDPHLVTLDGVEFDFFSIGEFWFARSVANDFGVQFRLFKFDGASAIGGVAVKVGGTTVTVMTVGNATGASTSPLVRVNGTLLVVPFSASTAIVHDLGVATMRVQPRVPNDTSVTVTLVAFEFRAGHSLSINVQYSAGMQRQYIDVQFSPTAAFLSTVSGLCGFMDGDQANDFTGGNGVVYNSSFVGPFGETWRVNQSKADGLPWSWDTRVSNFHANDSMDESYTDPSFVEVYARPDVDPVTLQAAKVGVCVCVARRRAVMPVRVVSCFVRVTCCLCCRARMPVLRCASPALCSTRASSTCWSQRT